MAAQKLSPVCTVLLVVGFLLVLIGSALMWHFTYTDSFAFFSRVATPESFRYNTCYFFFMWGSSLITAVFQRPNFMAVTCGLLGAIITFNFSLASLDFIRITLNNNPTDELKKLAAGCILNYIGAGLAFIASVLVFRNKANSESRTTLQLASAVFVIVFSFIGCLCIWTSGDVALNNGNPTVIRELLFDTTEGCVSVLIVFLIGVFCQIDHVMYFGAVISAFYNLSIMSTYLLCKGEPSKFTGTTISDAAAAGCVMLWLSTIAVIIHCALAHTAGTGYLNIESQGSSRA